MARVAIIGGGAAGMGAAIALAKAGMHVSLFESEPRLGGDCRGVSVSLWDGRTITVDGGMCEFNEAASTGFSALLTDLGIRCQPASTDASFMTPDRATAWFSRGGQPQFRQPLDDQTPFLDDIRRFAETCHEVLDDPTYADWPVTRYLDAKQYSSTFRRLYFDPQAFGWFAMADEPLIRGVVSSWRMLGIVGSGAEARMFVQGGMHTYCDAVRQWLRERKVSLHLSTRVVGVTRLGGGIRLRAIDREKANRTYSFDHVVVATNAGQVIPVLEDPLEEETRIYAGFEPRQGRLVVHQDPQLLPTDRATWGAYNYVVAPVGRAAMGGTVTVYSNRLQSLPASVPDVFVTLNPIREPEKDKIITDRTVVLPVGGQKSDIAALKVDAMQGKRRTWFCGGYLAEPFMHEQAYRSGLECGERLLEAVVDESLSFEAGASVTAGGFDDFLREIPLFADLDPRALSAVQLVARPFQVEAGTTLFRQGDPPDGLYLIKHGQIDILGRVPGDEVVQLAALGRSAIVGEMSLLDHYPRSAHAIAAEPTSGYFISSELFQILQSDFRAPAFAVMDCFRREVAKRARRVIGEISGFVPVVPACGGAIEWPAPSSSSSIDEAVLRSLPLFRTFRPGDLREFITKLKRFDFVAGQCVYAAGEMPRSCLMIVRGGMSMNQPGTIRSAAFAVRGPGQIMGEIALLDDGLQPLDCMAREPTIAFELDRIQFEALRQGGSVLALRFFDAVTSSAVATLRKGSAHLARLAAAGTPLRRMPTAAEGG